MKNFRDIAYQNVKKNKIFRGESLYHLSLKDQKLFKEKYNIKVVVDLRTNQEHNDKKNKVIKGIKYIHLPLITMEEMGASSEKEGKRNVIKNHKLPDIYDYYRRLVSPKRRDSWSEIFRLLLENDDGAIYFHCTVGKDRTGIVSALILTLLGIDKETIYKDYLITNEHPIIPFSYRIFALSLDKEFRKEFWEYFKAKKEYLDAAFTEIDKVYGSIDNFFIECCSLDNDKISKIKEKYLD